MDKFKNFNPGMSKKVLAMARAGRLDK